MLKVLHCIAITIASLLFSSLCRANEPELNSLPVQSFEVTHMLAREAIRKLALEYHVVIGISGTLVGSDDKTINLSLFNTTLKGALDAIVAADPRYRWTATQDSSISVTIGAPELELIHVRLDEFTISNQSKLTIASQLKNSPKIAAWLQVHSCTLNEITTMSNVTKEDSKLSLKVADQTVSQILDQISKETGSYSWLVLKFLNEPCAINVVP
jgi:hypothetical protein